MNTLFQTPYTLPDLDSLVEQKRAEYHAGQPFAHCVLDGLFPDELLDRVVEEFEKYSAWELRERENASHSKNVAPEYDIMGPNTKTLFALLGSPSFMNFVSAVTGVKGLITDPYMLGGGLHEIKPGGFLELHADFNWNPNLRMYRRLNLLLYLNRDWKEEWNGALELWDFELKKSASYLPLFNRIVLCDVNAKAMHGFPAPIACPPDRSRKSLALWYYTSEIPVNVQVHYDLCEPNFIRRVEGRPCPLKGPLWRQLVPPVAFRLFTRERRHTRPAHPSDFLRACTRLLPPAVVRMFTSSSSSER